MSNCVNTLSCDEDEDSEYAELRAQARHERAYNNRLSRAPDCRDPDHPGCPRCEPDEWGEDEEEPETNTDEDAE